MISFQARRINFCQALVPTILIVCPKAPFLRALKDFPSMENQIKTISQLRKKRLDMKSEKIQTQSTKIEQNKQVLLKKTEYIYNLLLRWIDNGNNNKQNTSKNSSLPKRRGKKGGLLESSTLKSFLDYQDMNLSRSDATPLSNFTRCRTLKQNSRKEESTNSLLNKLKTLKRGYTDKFKSGPKEKKPIISKNNVESLKQNQSKDSSTMVIYILKIFNNNLDPIS